MDPGARRVNLLAISLGYLTGILIPDLKTRPTDIATVSPGSIGPTVATTTTGIEEARTKYTRHCPLNNATHSMPYREQRRK